MTAAAPTQLTMDLRIPERRPLLPVKAAMVLLDRNEDDILALVGNRKLIAFNGARDMEGRQYLFIWRQSVIDYANDRSVNYTDDQIISDILPDRQTLRASEVKNLFSAGQWLISKLIEDGSLALDQRRAVKAGRGQSPWITRTSVVELLKERRVS